jgi:cyclopropane fatty-acyl-phospholipid synthase-like methyltransferase
MNCDPIARLYRWLEYAAFGNLLEQARFHWINSLTSAHRVLLLGDGDGRFLTRFALANRHAEIDSLELSQRMLQLAARRIARSGVTARSRIRLRQADALCDDPPHQTYDLVVANFFFDCFDESALTQLCRRISPHLRNNADWLVTDFRIPKHRLWSSICQAAIWIMYRFFHCTTGLDTSRLAGFSGVLAAAGFKCVHSASFAGGLVISEIWRRS